VDIGNRISFGEPWFLLLLLGLPLVWGLGRRSLTAMSPVRRWLAFGLRTAVYVFLVLALAEAELVRQHDRLTVFYLLDRSLSVPTDQADAARKFVTESVRTHRQQIRADRAGVIVFGREAAVEVPPIEGDFELHAFEAPIDREHTNLTAALKLAQASFPPDSAKRVVVVSDGNENLGQALGQARSLAEAGIGIDVLPVSMAPQPDVSVEKVALSPEIRQGAPFDLRVVLHNQAMKGQQATPVQGKLRVVRRSGEHEELVVEQDVTLEPGKRVFAIQDRIDAADFYTYEARFVPNDPAIDRYAQNNRATSFTHVQGRGRVLLIEDWTSPGEFDVLADRLRQEELEVEIRKSNELFDNLADLQRYDLVILANVARTGDDQGERVTEISNQQIALLVRNTRELGAGLVMLGGANSFGAGGWSGTELEKAMPVDFQIKGAEVVPVGALMLEIDRSGSMSGDKLELSKAAAREALKVLSPKDYVGVVSFDSSAYRVIPVQNVRSPERLAAQINTITPGGGTDMYPGMLEGYRSLAQTQASVKHMIVLSDGQTNEADFASLVKQMRAAQITVSAVAVGDGADRQRLLNIAQQGGGKFYAVDNPKAIPRIFVNEARRVARPVVYENDKGFAPITVGDQEILRGVGEPLPPLTGFVMTTLKESPLVELAMVSPVPGGRENTLLAAWTFGAGRAVAWTSDAGRRWAKTWPDWGGYDKLFAQMMRWALRPSDQDGRFQLAVDQRDGQATVVLNALDEQDRFLNALTMTGTVVEPDLSAKTVSIRQTAPGRYQGEFAATNPGSYFLTILPGAGRAPLRAGITVPYSAEYNERSSNDRLLTDLAGVQPIEGGPGKVLGGEIGSWTLEQALATNVFRGDLRPAESRRMAWPWCALLAAGVFFCDIFNRRVMVDPTGLYGWAAAAWSRVRGVRDVIQPEYLDRLKNSKRAVRESLAEGGARFEPAPAFSGNLNAALAEEPTPTVSAAASAAPKLAAEQQAAESYTERLLAAKRRARHSADDRP
jgi:Mg-chelatase subunit ChlD